MNECRLHHSSHIKAEKTTNVCRIQCNRGLNCMLNSLLRNDVMAQPCTNLFA